MPTRIDLQDIQDTINTIELDFYFFKIKGKFELPAKHTFLAITELDRYNVNGIKAIIDCLTLEQRKEFDSLGNVDKYAYLSKFALLNNLGSIDNLNDALTEAIASYKAKHINEFINNAFTQISNNNTGEIDFVDFKALAESETDSETKLEYLNVPKLSAKEANNLKNELSNADNINTIIFITFSYYKMGYKKIYKSLSESVRDFLLKLK